MERSAALIDAFIAGRVHAHRAPTPDVERAWQRLRETGGTIPIGTLTAELGCSRHHLAGRFRDQVGQPPKTSARLVRFQQVVQRLERGEAHRLAELAVQYGFYDQAHLNRDFRELAGATPTEFVAARLPDGAGIAA